MTSLKTIAKEISLKTSGSKAELIGRIVTYWGRIFTVDSEYEEEDVNVSSTSEQPFLLEKILSWDKSLSCLEDFNLVHLYNYLINSRDKTFDKESMKAFKSLKAYKYFSDGLVKNVWVHQNEDASIVIRGHCFSSLKAKATYVVYVILKKAGDVVSAKCKCVAGEGGACSHIAALLFYIEDIKRRDMQMLPSDRTVTDALQQWHVPPKRNVMPTPITNISFQKPAYGKVSKPHKMPSIQHKSKAITGSTSESLKKLVEAVYKCKPSCGVTHFWPDPAISTHIHEEPQIEATEPMEISDSLDKGLMILAKKLVIYADTMTSLPQSTIDFDEINPQGKYFKEVCHEYMSEQVIDQTLSDFIERETQQQSVCTLWKDLHNGRITSSKFGEIYNR